MTVNSFRDFPSCILESIPVAIVTMTHDFTITFFNGRAEELTGYSAREAVGLPCRDILRSSRCEHGCPLKTVRHYKKSATGLGAEIINRFGEHIPVRISSARIEDDDGMFIGYLEGIEDISREKVLEREKSNFLFMVAHDMKSPLVAIQGLVRRLQGHYREMTPSQVEKYFNIIQDAGEQIENQVAEFLEYSRQKTEEIKLNIEDADLEKLLDNLIYRHKSRAAEKNINIRSEYESSRQIRADSKQLERVFENLIDNALKFTHSHGEIVVSTRETNHETIVQVRDTGPGIDVVDLPYIFDAFHRSKSSETGHGLGLTAVKAIVHKHGGRVSVKSMLGRGSVFTVRLPKK